MINPIDNETLKDFLKRCVSMLINDDISEKEAIDICTKQWQKDQKIKLMNKAKNKAVLNQKIILK